MLSPDNAQLAFRDKTIPGLRLLLDPETFGERLGREFGQAVESSTCDYLRYKPGTSCLAQFTVRIEGQPTRLYVRAHSRETRCKLSKFAAHPSDAPPSGRNRLVWPDLSTGISFFPDDSGLPNLARLLSPETRGEVLSRALDQSFEAGRTEVVTLAYKPERRFVCRVDGDGTPRAVLKLYNRESFARVARSAKLIQPDGLLRTPRRLGRSGRHQILALEWADGELLRDTITSGSADRSLLTRVGEALALLHNRPGRKLLERPLGFLGQGVQAALPTLSILHPDLSMEFRRQAERISDDIRSRRYAPTTVHGDLNPRQILHTDETITFLDLDEAMRGDPLEDLGNFLAFLERQVAIGELSDENGRTARHHLLAGYADAGRSVDRAEIDLYTAAFLLRNAHYPFRICHPHWATMIASILERVKSLLPHHDTIRPATCSHRPAARSTPSSPEGADPAILGLDTAMDRVAASRMLRPVVEREIPGIGQLRSVRMVRHRPGRRCLIEYVFDHGPDGGTVELLGKIRAKGLDRRTFELQKQLYDGSFHDTGPDGICVPRPAGTVREASMWLQMKAPGVGATSLLTPDPQGERIGRRLAEVAAKLHQVDLSPERSHQITDEVTILRERLETVSRAVPDWAPQITAIFEGCLQVADGLAIDRPQTLIHRDYYPDHVLIDGGRASLIDLDLCCLGPPEIDIGNAVAHVSELSLRTLSDIDALRSVELAMIDRYLELRPLADPYAIEALAVLSLARHIHISTRIKGREKHMPALVRACEKRLELLSTGI